MRQRVSKKHYREILRVCFPLVLSLSATTLMEFTDRVFLANYSIDAISASLPAGITSFLFLAFFGGVSGYAGVFIAQYTGRGNEHRIGSVLYQGLLFSFAAGLVTAAIGYFAAEEIFALAGHAPEVQQLEVEYFSILSYGSVLHLAMVTLATFYTGRGLTRPVMVITVIGVIINIPLDYALIFGAWGLPELGIGGAGIATVSAWAVNVILLCLLIYTPANNRRFKIVAGCRFDPALFARIMRYGVPASLQFTFDILAFTLFIMLTGRIGKLELAATNIVLSINAIAFMPSMGASQGISVLVGQALGATRPRRAVLYVRGATHLLLAYIFVIDLLFLLAPDLVLAPFLSHGGPVADSESLATEARPLLQIVAAYLFFDALYMLYSGALRGAGDTRFLTLAIIVVAPCCLVLPVYFGISYFAIGITTAWIWVLVFITTLFLLSYFRFRRGLWKKMLVIESLPKP